MVLFRVGEVQNSKGADHGIDLVLDVDPQTEVAIRPLALQQVVLNLILHAIVIGFFSVRFPNLTAVAPSSVPLI